MTTPDSIVAVCSEAADEPDGQQMAVLVTGDGGGGGDACSHFPGRRLTPSWHLSPKRGTK